MNRYSVLRAAAVALALGLVSAPEPVLGQAGGTPAAGAADILEAAAMARARGSDHAAVVVFEIADFQCPFCARFSEEVFPSIDSAYVQTGRVQWVFVNLPLPAHREAWAAAEAAMCAGAVSGRFWQVHDALFRQQDEWAGQPDAVRRFRDYAYAAGVDRAAYDRCVGDDRVAPLIIQDILGASASQVSGTPTFIVNRQSKIVGLKTFDEWRQILDDAENAAR